MRPHTLSLDYARIGYEKKSTNAPAVDVRSELYRLPGVDLTRIEGVSGATARWRGNGNNKINGLT